MQEQQQKKLLKQQEKSADIACIWMVWLIMTLASLKNFIDHKMEHYGYDDVAHQCK